MDIFVHRSGQQMGPYSPDEVRRRIDIGQFSLTDLGWHVGLTTWQNLASILSPQPEPPMPPATPPPVRPHFAYAGFWRRVAAFIIDWLICLIPMFTIGVIIGLVLASSGSADKGTLRACGNIAGIIMWWLYFASMESSALQGTVGKLALSIKVTDMHGQRIAFGRATGRHFSKIISTLLLGIGFLMAGFTDRKQALHDQMANCLVMSR